MILSVLILSIESRSHFLARLMERLRPQECEGVEILTLIDNGERTIGDKRNALLAESKGKYVCFLDDDDDVPDDYVSSILSAAAIDPDSIGFRLSYSINGKYDADALHTIRNEAWETVMRDGVKVYLRTPNHLNPIRREIATRYPFPEINHGEDHNYSQRIQHEIRTEVFIDRVMYRYLFRTQKDQL